MLCMVLICASDCEESCPGSSSSNSAFPSMEVSALFTLCFMSSMYRPSVAWFSFLAALRSACRAICKAFARRSDSPATSRSVCAQSSRSGMCTRRGYLLRNCPNPWESACAHKMIAVAGSSDRNTLLIFPSRTGPTTTRSWAGASCFCHDSLLRTVMLGAWGSACQQAVSNRANSVSSVRMTTLACRKENPLPEVSVRPRRTSSHRLQLFCFVQRREQTFRTDPEVYRCFRILRLLGNIHALLQSSDFHARDVHRPLERRGIPRFLGGFGCRRDQHPGHHGPPQILRGRPVFTDERRYFP